MRKRTAKLLQVSLAVFSYLAPIGLGIWSALLRKQTASSSELEPPGSKPQQEPASQQKYQSLSLDAPGEAPLDRLARIAARERRVENQVEDSNLKALVVPGSDNPRPPEPRSVANLLDHQSLASCRLEGWNVPEPERLPVPTYAPATMAFGILIFAMGLATTWYVCVVGSLVFAVAAWRWVGELQGH